MLMVAVVVISGKQYKVKPGDTVLVDKMSGKAGDAVTFDSVLLTHDEGKTKIGSPNVAQAKVKVKIIEHIRGEKIDVHRFRAKSRHRRKRGFRAQLEIVAVG
jgi:large subunit ribosomal protein L21